MTSKECLKRIDERNYLTQREHKEFLSVVKQDLDRLEVLEKTFDILKGVLDRVLIFKFKEDIISGGNIYFSKIDNNNITIVNLRKIEYELLKEVLENGL